MATEFEQRRDTVDALERIANALERIERMLGDWEQK